MSDNPIEALNEKQHNFMINHFFKGMTQQDAYLEAGYDAEPGASAKSAASQLANKDKIKKALKAVDADEYTETTKKIGTLQISDKVKDAVATLGKIQRGEFDDANKARVMKESAVEVLDRAGVTKKQQKTEEGKLSFNFDLSESEAREIEADFSEIDEDDDE